MISSDVINTNNHLEETRKHVFRGERGPLPPISAQLFSTDQKMGRRFEPPQIFGPAMETYCQSTGKCPEMTQHAGKRHKTPENAAKHQKTPEKLQLIAKLPGHRKKICRKTPHATAKHSKMPQNAINILQIGNMSSRDQIFGGAKKTRPLFSC